MEIECGSENKHNERLEVITEGSKYSFEKVHKFNYLGVTITDNGEEKEEIQERIAKGTKSMGGLLHILKSKRISRKVKERIYRTIIRPVVIYGSEAWKLNLKEKQSLEIFERKVLRKIYGGKKIGQIWERRTNKEILDLYGEPSISSVARVQRMRWLLVRTCCKTKRRRIDQTSPDEGNYWKEKKRQTEITMDTNGGRRPEGSGNGGLERTNRNQEIEQSGVENATKP
jgi:hypothetical protein